MPIDTIAAWHDLVRRGDAAALDALLADEVVFHSPVVHKPQPGKALTQRYLTAAMQAIRVDSFRYVRQVVGARDAVLEFIAEIDGVTVNGIDMFHWNDAGLIDDFKVMVRPIKGIEMVHRKMAETLATMPA